MKSRSEHDRLEFVTVRIEEIQENIKEDPSRFWKYTKMKNKTSGFPSTIMDKTLSVLLTYPNCFLIFSKMFTLTILVLLTTHLILRIL